MRPIALTGGIGAGKSTVAQLLRARGAFVVDADQLARDVVAPGTRGHAAVVEAFGRTVVAPDGSLDRAALATRVFADAQDRERLEAIVHPLVEAAAQARFADAPIRSVRIYELPLLEGSREATDRWAAVIVVDADDDVRVARLIGRGMAAEDARQRMAAQASRQDRLALADFVLDNNRTPSDLARQVEQLWPRLVALG